MKTICFGAFFCFVLFTVEISGISDPIFIYISRELLGRLVVLKGWMGGSPFQAVTST